MEGATLTLADRPSEEILQEIADGNLGGIGPLAYDRAPVPGGMDAEAHQLVQIAALAAVDAPAASWFHHLGGHETIEVDKVLETLIVVAPIVGSPRLVSAAAKFVGVTDLAEEREQAEP
jgi:hypothetical protein